MSGYPFSGENFMLLICAAGSLASILQWAKDRR